MSKVYTTEITSENIPSDNPIHQRLLKPYVVARELVRGDVLEVGCGEGRGIPLILPAVSSYTAIDKIGPVINDLRQKYPSAKFYEGNIPPMPLFPEGSFDFVISFQVIEHIANDHLFVKELHRVLKPGGVALISTPNRPLSLSRNPWHVREYTAEELSVLAYRYFPKVQMKGITGNSKVMEYYERNRKSVQKLMRWDILDLQHRLPAPLLRIPYELMNRLNRNKLRESSDGLVASIRHEDYLVTDKPEEALDLFVWCTK